MTSLTCLQADSPAEHSSWQPGSHSAAKQSSSDVVDLCTSPVHPAHMTPVAPQAGVATAGSNTTDARDVAEAMDVDTAGKLTKQQPASCIDALATSHQSLWCCLLRHTALLLWRRNAC